MKKWFLILFVCIGISHVYAQSMINVEGEKTLYLGTNVLDSCKYSYKADCWRVEDGKLYRFSSDDLTPFVFKVTTEPNVDYYFHVTQDAGTLTNAFHVGIGENRLVDPYNLTTEMGLLLRADGGELKIVPISGKEFTLSNIRLSRIEPSQTNDSVLLELNSVSIGMESSSVGGKWNVAIGDMTTMASNLNASRSIAIGHNSMTYLEGGIQNIGIGTFSLHELKYGERNLAFGPDALYRTKYAYDNVAIGRATLANSKYSQADITLKRNIAIGNFAEAYNSVSTHDAVAVGYYSNAQCGDESVSMGNYSNYLGGNRNVAIGHFAGRDNNREENVIIGYNALPGNGKGRGDGNILIGANTDLVGPVTNSVIIGRNSISHGKNSIVIGSDMVCDKPNQTIIGNQLTSEAIIYGDLIVRGSDGQYRKIVFKNDGSCAWEVVESDNTAIKDASRNMSVTTKDGIYDLSGRKLNRIHTAGIYIINGDKMYVNPQY